MTDVILECSRIFHFEELPGDAKKLQNQSPQQHEHLHNEVPVARNGKYPKLSKSLESLITIIYL